MTSLFAACEDILEVPDISGESVELLAPRDQTTVTDTIVGFNWSGVAEANSYNIQLAQPDFESAAQVLLDSIMVIDSTSNATSVSAKLSAGNYEWRVKALNSDYQTEFSAARFSVDPDN